MNKTEVNKWISQNEKVEKKTKTKENHEREHEQRCSWEENKTKQNKRVEQYRRTRSQFGEHNTNSHNNKSANNKCVRVCVCGSVSCKTEDEPNLWFWHFRTRSEVVLGGKRKERLVIGTSDDCHKLRLWPRSFACVGVKNSEWSDESSDYDGTKGDLSEAEE